MLGVSENANGNRDSLTYSNIDYCKSLVELLEPCKLQISYSNDFY